MLSRSCGRTQPRTGTAAALVQLAAPTPSDSPPQPLPTTLRRGTDRIDHETAAGDGHRPPCDGGRDRDDHRSAGRRDDGRIFAPLDAATTAAFFDITNTGAAADTLESVSSPSLGVAMLGRNVSKNGTGRMEPVESLVIPEE
ncbi:copper chaperone PCu(A)C [Streptomyces sp. NPDC002888]|uniref:copper chaperone PCu(A)C n=1 Tax=Streptomyces sp. NPDC002888 TaxID=3364668 RepID=UPI0036AEA8E4